MMPHIREQFLFSSALSSFLGVSGFLLFRNIQVSISFRAQTLAISDCPDKDITKDKCFQPNKKKLTQPKTPK